MHIRNETYEKAVGNESIRTHRMYTGFELEMTENRKVEAEDDFFCVSQIRYSHDNGRTWSAYIPDEMNYEKNGEREIVRNIASVEPNAATGHMVRTVMRRTFLYNHSEVYGKYWKTGVMDWRDHTFVEISRDGGKTYTAGSMLAYEQYTGIDFNHGYHGNNIEIDLNGTMYTAISAPVESVCRAFSRKTGDYALNGSITNAVIVFRISYDASADAYTAEPSEPVIISDAVSSRGLLEPNVVLLLDGTIMLECRGSNAVAEGWRTRMKKGSPSHRWVSYSGDGRNFSIPSPMLFDDGTAFYSPSSMSRWLRHSVNGRLYWAGNITGRIPEGNRPRYPLCIAQFDEDRRCLVKESMGILDDRKPGDGGLVQFSNFTFYEDREAHVMHLEYSRLGQNAELKWQGDAVRATVSV
ncbi:MAG: hypothetical protein JXB33_07005 [Clostridia bacterium]|nr:hypothetical protein [Clostridia bacterium]